MTTTSRTFRIFVSSTFSDLVAERNALQERVFPRLRELAAAYGCAVSPDGTWIVSASDDGALRIWNAASGAQRALLVLPGAATAVAFHPFAPIVTCGDAGGGVHVALLVGIDLGPLVVTAATHDSELPVRCPACQHRF